MKRCKRAKKRLEEPLRSHTFPLPRTATQFHTEDSRFVMRKTSPVLSIRAANGWSIATMAKKIGYSANAIMHLERGTTIGTAKTLKLLSDLTPDPLLWISQYHAWIAYHRSIGNRK